MAYKLRTYACENCGTSVVSSNPRKFCSLRCDGLSRRKYSTKLCASCGTSFYSSRPSQIYCCHKCGRDALRCRAVQCDVCKTVFQPTHDTSRRFCSRKCQGIAHRKGTIIKCIECGNSFYATIRAIAAGKAYCSIRCHNKALNRYNASRGHFVSNTEKAFAKILESCQIEFKSQVVVDRLTCDFLIPSSNLIIEVNGDYWHGNPKTFPNPSPLQSERRRSDKRRDWVLRQFGFSVWHVWEDDIKHNRDFVVKELRKRTGSR